MAPNKVQPFLSSPTNSWSPKPGMERQTSERIVNHWRSKTTALSVEDGGSSESYDLHPNISRALKELEEDWNPENDLLTDLIHKHKLPLPGKDRLFTGEYLQNLPVSSQGGHSLNPPSTPVHSGAP